MSKMTPSEALVETMVAQNVDVCFGIMGSAFMDAMDIFDPAGIRFISVVHEQGAAHMADGYARISGKHGVCIAQNGPGITNFVTAIAAAFWAHSPVVVITPETGSMTNGLGGFQEAQQLPFFETITKFQAHVSRPERMAELTARAFDRAMQHNGPTQLNIPRDHFYGTIETDIPAPIRIERSAGGETSLQQAAKLLSDADFPVILAGGGVVMSDAIETCIELAELLTAPVCNTYLHNDSFPSNHALAVGPLGYQGSKAAMKLISKADVVLAIGTRLGPFGTLPQHDLDYWPKQAEIIQIDCDPDVIGLVKPISIGICGDAKAATASILSQLQQLMKPDSKLAAQRNDLIQKEKQAWAVELKQWKHETDAYSLQVIDEQQQEPENWLHPREVLQQLEQAMPEHVIVSTDIGNICSVANSYLKFNQNRSFLAPMSFGNCGYALPTIIGAKVAAPDRPVVAYVGDGAWAMSMSEIMTSIRENIPVTAVVFHNRQWGAEKKNQVDFYDHRFVAADLNNPSFADIAIAMGAQGVQVHQLSDVQPVFEKAIEDQLKNKRTTVVEIMCTRELGDPFRRDALSKPVRYLEKYQDFR